MIRQQGYNIIIELQEPPKSIIQTYRSMLHTKQDTQNDWWSLHQEMIDNYEYERYVENLKKEIKDYATKVFTKDIAKDITKEAVKCVDDVVRETLK